MEVLWRTWWVIVIVSLCAVVVVPRPRLYPKRMPFTDSTLRYLMSFGYLPASDLETGNLRTDDQLREAIKDLQRFGNIPVTGEVDEATETLMAGARCGVSDLQDPETSRRKRFAIYSGPRWDHTDLTWSLRTRHLEQLDHGQVRRDLHEALAVWSRDSNLTFREVNSDDADILVMFHSGEHGDGYAFDGPGRILAHAFFPGDDRGGDVHFDQEETWLLEYQHTGDDGDGTRLLMVAAHEFGHSLGLSHSSDPTSLMFPWYQSLGENFVLPEDDRRGIQQLYGAKNRWATIPKFNPGDGQQPWRPSYKPAVRANPPLRTTSTTTTTSTTSTTSTTTRRPFHRHHHYRTTVPPSGKPNKCDTSYDAVSVIRRETFIFKDQYMWRINDGGVMEGYPAPIVHLWKSLPKNLTHIDAVYERLDKKIVFFIGQEMYLFDGNELVRGYPKSLRSLGLPHEVDHIDAAMVWGYNSKTYFFSGNIYWRFDEDEQHVELDYPRVITVMWKGMGSHFDAAFQWKDGKTYFFKNKGFWKLNDMRMRAENEHPLPSAAFWMNCSNYDIGHIPTKTKIHKKWSRLEAAPPVTAGSFITSSKMPVYVILFLFHLLPR